MNSQEIDPREFLFDFVLYLVTCARLHLDEKPIYGAFRMIEGASRLIEAAESLPGWEVDAFLEEQRTAIEAGRQGRLPPLAERPRQGDGRRGHEEKLRLGDGF